MTPKASSSRWFTLVVVCLTATSLTGCTRWKAFTSTGDPRLLMMPPGFYSIFKPDDKKKQEKKDGEEGGKKEKNDSDVNESDGPSS